MGKGAGGAGARGELSSSVLLLHGVVRPEHELVGDLLLAHIPGVRECMHVRAGEKRFGVSVVKGT